MFFFRFTNRVNIYTKSFDTTVLYCVTGGFCNYHLRYHRSGVVYGKITLHLLQRND